MATTDIVCHTAMGSGSPVFAPVPNWAETLSSDGATTAETIGGAFVTVTAVDGAVRFYVTGEAGKTYALTDGGEKTIGPMQDGQTITVAAIT